jgi:hypothetical protein
VQYVELKQYCATLIAVCILYERITILAQKRILSIDISHAHSSSRKISAPAAWVTASSLACSSTHSLAVTAAAAVAVSAVTAVSLVTVSLLAVSLLLSASPAAASIECAASASCTAAATVAFLL